MPMLAQVANSHTPNLPPTDSISEGLHL
jgi:hypothetical protein